MFYIDLLELESVHCLLKQKQFSHFLSISFNIVMLLI